MTPRHPRSSHDPSPRPDPAAEWSALLAGLVERWSDLDSDRKQARSRKREQQILQAALRVFARDGIARARIGDIGAEAGMPVSSLYDYFPSKEDIAYAVPRHHLGQFFGEFAAAVTTATTWRERLRIYLRVTAGFAQRNPEWARTFYLEIWPSVLASDNPVNESINDYLRVVVHLLRQGAAAGEWSDAENVYESASILTGAVNQVIITWLLYRKPADLTGAIESVIERSMTLLSPGGRDRAFKRLSRRRSPN